MGLTNPNDFSGICTLFDFKGDKQSNHMEERPLSMI